MDYCDIHPTLNILHVLLTQETEWQLMFQQKLTARIVDFLAVSGNGVAPTATAVYCTVTASESA